MPRRVGGSPVGTVDVLGGKRPGASRFKRPKIFMVHGSDAKDETWLRGGLDWADTATSPTCLLWKGYAGDP